MSKHSIQASDVGIEKNKRTTKTKVKRIVCISDTHNKQSRFQKNIPEGDILFVHF
jgi:hypothetical protein